MHKFGKQVNTGEELPVIPNDSWSASSGGTRKFRRRHLVFALILFALVDAVFTLAFVRAQLPKIPSPATATTTTISTVEFKGEVVVQAATTPLSFGEYVADQLQVTGLPPPKGCEVRSLCVHMCNAESSRDSCLTYAKTHSMISPKQVKEMLAIAHRLRKGLSGMPTNVDECIQANLGVHYMNAVMSGEVLPSPSAAQSITACFDLYQEVITESESKKSSTAGTKNIASTVFAPYEWSTMPLLVHACVSEKIGSATVEHFVNRTLVPDASAEAARQACLSGGKVVVQTVSVSGSGAGRTKSQSTGNTDSGSAPVHTGSGGVSEPVFGGISYPGQIPKTEAAQTDQLCAMFDPAPTCAEVSTDVQDLCKKCKGE